MNCTQNCTNFTSARRREERTKTPHLMDKPECPSKFNWAVLVLIGFPVKNICYQTGFCSYVLFTHSVVVLFRSLRSIPFVELYRRHTTVTQPYNVRNRYCWTPKVRPIDLKTVRPQWTSENQCSILYVCRFISVCAQQRKRLNINKLNWTRLILRIRTFHYSF